MNVRRHAIPLAALLLVGGAAVVLGFRHRSEAPPEHRPAVVAPAAPAGVRHIPPALLASPSSTLAQQLTQLLGKSEFGEGASLPLTPAEATRWETREALRETLARNPEGWRDVIDLLASGGDYDKARRVVVLARPAVDARAESVLLELLGTRSDSGARRLAIVALGGRPSPATLQVLEATMSQDANSGVRLLSMTTLSQQKDQVSPALRAEIVDAIRRRGKDESDPQVRDAARRLSGEKVSVVQAPPPAAPPKRAPLGR